MTKNSSNLFYQICTKVFQKTYLEDLMIKEESSFDIAPYKINKLYADAARKLYNLSKFKYDISKELQPNPDAWYENQRKLLICFIVCYFHEFLIQERQQSKIHIFQSSIDWREVSNVFFDKNISLLKFQFNNILKQKQRISWTLEQDQLLCTAVHSAGKGCWNDISKQIYLQSGLTFFKTPKHCRERWFNHLDDSKKRGKWTDQQDYNLLNFVKEYGKKCSRIAQYLNHTRTQHMVKNRFNSLMTKIRRNTKQRETNTINKILRHLEVSLRGSFQREEKQVPIIELVSSQLISHQQIQKQKLKIKDIEPPSQHNFHKGINQVQNFLPTMKTQSEINVQPLQSIFINFLVPSNTFLQPPVIFCYNMLPATHYINQKANNLWSFIQQSPQNSPLHFNQSCSFKTQSVYIIQQNDFTK